MEPSADNLIRAAEIRAADIDRLVRGATAWWAEAGVTLDFVDEAVNWLAPPPGEAPARGRGAKGAAGEPRRGANGNGPPGAASSAPLPSGPLSGAAHPATPPIGGDPAQWPSDLAAFRDWWLTEPSLDLAPPQERVPPRGPKDAALMVLVPMPEAEDGDELLSGRCGALLKAMLPALGVSPESLYLACALPRHTLAPDWAALGRAGLGKLLRHHVALAAPARVLAFGSHIPPLLGHDPAQISASLPIINQDGGSVPVLHARDLAMLLDRPAAKSGFWRDWLDWTR